MKKVVAALYLSNGTRAIFHAHCSNCKQFYYYCVVYECICSLFHLKIYQNWLENFWMQQFYKQSFLLYSRDLSGDYVWVFIYLKRRLWFYLFYFLYKSVCMFIGLSRQIHSTITPIVPEIGVFEIRIRHWVKKNDRSWITLRFDNMEMRLGAFLTFCF